MFNKTDPVSLFCRSNSHLRRSRGITLVEALTALSISAVLAGVIYSFILFSSKTMRKMTAMQLMQQESSLISEVFMREIRNGTYVSVASTKVPPDKDTANIKSIQIRNADSTARTSFQISGNKFIINWHLGSSAQILCDKLWEGGDTPNRFTVYQNGDHVDFYINLCRTIGDDTLYLSQTVGDVRCKN
jgi:Tfp pilus assembly protein PilE